MLLKMRSSIMYHAPNIAISVICEFHSEHAGAIVPWISLLPSGELKEEGIQLVYRGDLGWVGRFCC